MVLPVLLCQNSSLAYLHANLGDTNVFTSPHLLWKFSDLKNVIKKKSPTHHFPELSVCNLESKVYIIKAVNTRTIFVIFLLMEMIILELTVQEDEEQYTIHLVIGEQL